MWFSGFWTGLEQAQHVRVLYESRKVADVCPDESMGLTGVFIKNVVTRELSGNRIREI